MKTIKCQEILKTKIIKSKLLNRKCLVHGITVGEIEKRLKKILGIIFHYGMFDKKILFIGNFEFKDRHILDMLKKTEHDVMNLAIFSGSLHDALEKLDQKLDYDPDKNPELIITFGQKYPEEFKKRIRGLNIFIICLNDNLDISDNTFAYKVFGDFNENKKNDLFWLLISAVFKKVLFLKKKKKKLRSYVLRNKWRFLLKSLNTLDFKKSKLNNYTLSKLETDLFFKKKYFQLKKEQTKLIKRINQVICKKIKWESSRKGKQVQKRFVASYLHWLAMTYRNKQFYTNRKTPPYKNKRKKRK